MPHPTLPQTPDGSSSSELVRQAIQNFQQTRALWDDTADQPLEHEIARLQLRIAQEQLFLLIADALSTVARQWIRSPFGRSLASVDDAAALPSLALTLYLEVIEELLKVQINPSKDPISLIKLIAQRRMNDKYRRAKRENAMRAALGIGPAIIPSDMPEQDIVDPESLDQEDKLINQLYNKALVKDIWDFWRKTLNQEDQQIMRHREKDPPTTFKDIAELLGPGCSEGMVKMRYHRVIRRTFIYFQQSKPPPNEK